MKRAPISRDGGATRAKNAASHPFDSLCSLRAHCADRGSRFQGDESDKISGRASALFPAFHPAAFFDSFGLCLFVGPAALFQSGTCASTPTANHCAMGDAALPGVPFRVEPAVLDWLCLQRKGPFASGGFVFALWRHHLVCGPTQRGTLCLPPVGDGPFLLHRPAGKAG